MQTKVLVFILAALASGSVIDIHINSNDDSTHQFGGVSSATAQCYWDGTSPFCAGGCPSGYSDCGRSTSGDGATCWTGYKVYCCQGNCQAILPSEKKPLELSSGLRPAGWVDSVPQELVLQSDVATVSCYWDGTSPFCAGGCPQGYNDCGRSTSGDGATCWTGYKVHCCNGACPSNTGLTAVKETPNDKLRTTSGDYDDICGKGKFICCPLGANKNEECICLDKKSQAPTISTNPHLLTDDDSHDDICKKGERICCPPGATKNKQCRCAPEDKYMSLEL